MELERVTLGKREPHSRFRFTATCQARGMILECHFNTVESVHRAMETIEPGDVVTVERLRPLLTVVRTA